MALQALRFVIDAKADGAVRSLKAVERELDLLERDAKQAGVAFDRVGERGAKLGGLQKSIAGVSAATGLSEERVKQLGSAAAVAGVGIAVAFGVKAVNAASDFNEALSKSNVIFGEASAGVLDFAKSANAIGLSDRAALSAAGSFGTLLVNVGQTRQQAADMSTRLVALAADLASFNNTSVADALTAISSGLVGEAEPLRRYGVLLNDATLRQQALKDGLIATTTQALTPAQKALTTYSVLLGQTTNQQGDFARTQGGYAGQVKTLSANIDDLSVAIGEKLLPVLTDFVAKINDVGPSAGRSLGPLGDLYGAVKKIADVPGVGKAIEIANENFSPWGQASKAIKETERDLRAVKGAAESVGKATGILTTKINLNTTAFKQLEEWETHVDRGYAAMSAAAKRAGIDVDGSAAAAVRARTEYNRLTGEALRLAGGLGVAAAQANSLGVQLNAGGLALEGPGSHPPPIQVNEVLIDFQTGLDRYQAALGAATSSGASDGFGSSEVEDSIDHVAEYLESVARERIENLGNVFEGITAKFSFDDAKADLEEAAQKLADLKNEAVSTKTSAAQQQSLVGQLLQQSLQITPEEQVTIERAEKNLADIKARFYGVATETTAAPASSFLGPTSIDKVVAGVKPTLAELQVAENELAKAKADAVGPTRELEEAQKKLDDLRERGKELPKAIADAQRDLTRAQLGLVEAQRRQVDVGAELLDQGPEFTDWFKQLATDAGLPRGAIDALTQSIGRLRQVAGASQGLIDVFGNGSQFAKTPDEANAILSYISGINGGGPIKKFAQGGIVPGPFGAPVPAIVHGGEKVLTAAQQRAGGGMVVNLSISAWDQGSIPAITRAVRGELASMLKRAS